MNEHYMYIITNTVQHHDNFCFLLSCCLLLLFSVLFIKSWTSSLNLTGSMIAPTTVHTLGLISWWKVASEFQWHPVGEQCIFSNCF